MHMNYKVYKTLPGNRYPAGATLDAGGVNFSVFSQHASSVELLLYEKNDSTEPFQIIRLVPDVNLTFFFWHVYVEGLQAGVHYTWRIDGPKDTRRTGFRFNKKFELLDPWARAVSDTMWDRRRAQKTHNSTYTSMRAIVVDNEYDWEGDKPVNHPLENSIIYEVHVGGFTKHQSSGVANPGTYAGLVEKIPYLQELGITDVELLPVMAFDEQALPDHDFKKGMRNFWGYMTHSFFSPHPSYCIDPAGGSHQREFRDMVKALHKAGIGVILDVVFNHTAESGVKDPNMNFRGFGNEIYYHLDQKDRRLYRDYTGCGNSLNCNHPLVASFIVTCLEYWVREMHVDGFRFDLASVLARGEDGRPLKHAPVLWNIEFSDVLAHTKIIAEAWDVGGLYQVGDFPGYRWAEWNGRYRDLIRQFVHGDKGIISEAATRISGSSDLYQSDGKLPVNSINFLTCHDGFTLYDLISQNKKYDESMRKRQVKNCMAILLLSQGVPMILGGDEIHRTQSGVKNAYCQDNKISWYDWSMLRGNGDIFRFVKMMIGFRKRHPSLMRKRFLTGRKHKAHGVADVTWHGTRLHKPQWSDPNAQLLAYTLGGIASVEEDIHVILNMSDNREMVSLPSIPGKKWFVTVDTSQVSPQDIHERSERLRVRDHEYLTDLCSVVVLESQTE